MVYETKIECGKLCKNQVILCQDGYKRIYTVEPPNMGQFGANRFAPCREVVHISEGPLSEVPLYLHSGSQPFYSTLLFVTYKDAGRTRRRHAISHSTGVYSCN